MRSSYPSQPSDDRYRGNPQNTHPQPGSYGFAAPVAHLGASAPTEPVPQRPVGFNADQWNAYREALSRSQQQPRYANSYGASYNYGVEAAYPVQTHQPPPIIPPSPPPTPPGFNYYAPPEHWPHVYNPSNSPSFGGPLDGQQPPPFIPPPPQPAPPPPPSLRHPPLPHSYPANYLDYNYGVGGYDGRRS